MYTIIDEKKIFNFMFEHGITRTELAHRAKIQRKTLYNFLNCKHRPSFYVQSRLYRAMKEITKEQRMSHKKSPA